MSPLGPSVSCQAHSTDVRFSPNCRHTTALRQPTRCAKDGHRERSNQMRKYASSRSSSNDRSNDFQPSFSRCGQQGQTGNKGATVYSWQQVVRLHSHSPTAVLHPASRRQRQRRQFFPGRTEGAELIDRRAGRRERERREWLRQHLVQLSFRSDPDRHMRIEPFACGHLDEVGDVLNQRFLNVASACLAEEGRRGPGLHSVGLDGSSVGSTTIPARPNGGSGM